MHPLLQSYFDQLQHSGIRHPALLAPDAVLSLSAQFAGHPLVDALAAYVLDDDNSSKHHLLLTAPPLAGHIYYLTHDGDDGLAFESAADYLAAMAAARDDEPEHQAVIAADQAGLSAFLLAALADPERADLVPGLIPALDLQDHTLLRTLASDEDFFVGEAVASAIAQRPAASLQDIAQLCAAHKHPQVAKAGARALRAIRAL